MSQIQKWLKGQQSKKKKKDPKSKDAKSTPEHKAVVAHKQRVQLVPAGGGNATAPRLHTKPKPKITTKTPNRPGGNITLQNTITVIPEGRKEIHISVTELRSFKSRVIETGPLLNRRRDGILASNKYKTGESTPSRVFPVTTSKRQAPFSPTPRGDGQTLRSRAVPTTPLIPAKATPLSARQHIGRVRVIKFGTSHPLKAGRVYRTSEPHSAVPTVLTSAISKDNGTKVPSDEPVRPAASRPVKPTKAHNVPSHPILSRRSEYRYFGSDIREPSVQNPSSRPGPKFQSKPRTNILKLPPELILNIASHLPYTSAVFLKISCKQLNRFVRIKHLQPSTSETISVLQQFPPTRTFKGDRNPPYLCQECVMWHTFEHMTIYPHPRPESAFQNYADYKIQRPRKCLRYAMKSGQWRRGQKIDSEHSLCASCVTPKERKRGGKCSWNCGRCGGCTGRKGWSAMCVGCWRFGDGEEMRNGVGWSALNSIAKPHLYRASGSKVPALSDDQGRRTCGRCLGLLNFEPGSKEVCQCSESRSSFSDNREY